LGFGIVDMKEKHLGLFVHPEFEIKESEENFTIPC
jgi:hypothetical protein